MDSRDVDRAVAVMTGVLEPHTDRDWRVRAGRLDWTCWTTAAHIAHDLLAYASQLVALPKDRYLPFDLTIATDAPPHEVLRIVTACGRLLSAAVAAADQSDRAWHWGLSDREGFAAMGVAETVLHTYDITRGLDIEWLPPEDLCAGVLARLFPDAPPGEPVQTLLWCTGRADLDGHPRRTEWRWQAARPDSAGA